jgi:hemoglobin-like flavoprotein
MNLQQIELVQQSWKKVVPIADQAAALFYERLFELDPTVKPLFRGDIKSQGRKLTSMINTAVVNLGDLAGIVPAVQDLGRRHVRYGVRPAHYDTVGAALLWTLEKGLGEVFTPATREAWAKAYATLAGVMQAAAAEGAAGPQSAPLAAAT